MVRVSDMAQKKHTKQGVGTAPGWRVADEIRDQFTRWCDGDNHGYEDEFAAAIFLWPKLPATMQAWVRQAIAGNPEYGASFWLEFEQTFDEAAHELKKKLRASLHS